MRYVDTSVFVSALIPEITSDRALRWLSMQQEGTLATSAWVEVEFTAAISRKLRMDRIGPAERERALVEFREAWLPVAAILQLETRHYRLAAAICEKSSAGIRAGDAVHLAVAATANAMVCTFDLRFVQGARSLGYSIELIE